MDLAPYESITSLVVLIDVVSAFSSFSLLCEWEKFKNPKLEILCPRCPRV